MSNELWVLAAAVVLLTFLPWSSRYANPYRTTVIMVLLLLQARYLHWRVTASLPDFQPDTPHVLMYLFLGLELYTQSFAIREAVAYCTTRQRHTDADQNENWYANRAKPQVDIFIPTYNESTKLVDCALITAACQDYPNVRVWLLDDGRRKEMQDLARLRNVEYLTRPDNKHAKAGNINYALSHVAGLSNPPEFFGVIDCDFTVRPEFIRRTLSLMVDPQIAIVQTKQLYYNLDPFQHAFGPKTLPDWQRSSFDVGLPMADARNDATCCGTGFLGRVSALAEIGGFQVETVSEDWLTTKALQARGYVVAYLNEGLSSGLVAEGLREFLTQCHRWCLGGVQGLYTRFGAFSREPTSLLVRAGRLETSLAWGFFSSFNILYICLPAIMLNLEISPFGNARLADSEAYWAPFFVFRVLVGGWLSNGTILPILSEAREFLASFATVRATYQGLTRSKNNRFIVTDKGALRPNILIHWDVLQWILLIAAFTILGMCRTRSSSSAMNGMFYFWTGYTLTVLAAAATVCFEPRKRREEERFETRESARLGTNAGLVDVQLSDISLSGASMFSDQTSSVPDETQVFIEGVGVLAAKVVRRETHRLCVAFRADQQERRKLVLKLFNGNYVKTVWTASIGRVYWTMMQRILL